MCVEIFNELVRPKRATYYFDVLSKIFNNCYAYKRRGNFKAKGGKGPVRLMSMDLNPKD